MSRLRGRLGALRSGGFRGESIEGVRPTAGRLASHDDEPAMVPHGVASSATPASCSAAPFRVSTQRLAPTARHGDVAVSELAHAWGAARVVPEALARLCALARADWPAAVSAEDLLFLDLETNGLSLGGGHLAWALALGRIDGRGGVTLERAWLERPSGEAQMLEWLEGRIDAAGAIVTYNGRSFDLPLLESRLALVRRRRWSRPPDLDLLHPVRRMLCAAGEGARLGEVETRILGVRRVDDLPSSEVPAAWRALLTTGRRGPLVRVLSHVRDDVLSLIGLTARLLQGCVVSPPEGAHPPLIDVDALGVAELRHRAGQPFGALATLDASNAALAPGGLPADDVAHLRRGLRRARLVKRLAGADAARGHWAALLDGSPDRPEPWEELAKVLEHRDGDAARALRLVEDALLRFGRRGSVRARLEHRAERLRRKLRSTAGAASERTGLNLGDG